MTEKIYGPLKAFRFETGFFKKFFFCDAPFLGGFCREKQPVASETEQKAINNTSEHIFQTEIMSTASNRGRNPRDFIGLIPPSRH